MTTMTRRSIRSSLWRTPAAVVLLLGGCGGRADEGTTADKVAGATPEPEAAIAVNGEAPEIPVPMPTPVRTGSAPLPDTAATARAVVIDYFDLLKQGRSTEAAAYRDDAARSVADSTKQLERFSSYTIKAGEPGRIDSGAGQRHVTVPIVARGSLKPNNPVVVTRGTVTLHRTADIPGATAAQKSWRIRSVDLVEAGKPTNEANTPQPANPTAR